MKTLKIELEFRAGGFWPIRRSFSMRLDDEALRETVAGFVFGLIEKGGWAAANDGAKWKSGQFSASISISDD